MQAETNVIDFQPGGYISSKQLCERYGNLSKRTLLYWRETKGFPLPCFTGKMALYSKADVIAWEQQNFQVQQVG
ncbi:helix-turn-helix domain-containing protein [Salinimonas marina]|uniref:Helix-turn-helix domain-containing protein n=1 Tax=Salinimonas marina TaxID=2785918 RepID=A0A7S9DZ63_9ALTE|nr:helix-turn-helix domain-containing protein [Salinimonas marina]QPG06527.1 helix-turn-helix domain-containing protein [Salinimonas marina]